MKYYLEKNEHELLGNEANKLAEVWKEKYGVRYGLWHINVSMDKGDTYISREARTLNPHTVGPKILGGKLILSDVSSLYLVRQREPEVYYYYMNKTALGLELLPGNHVEVDFYELIEYADIDLTAFFNSCLDVVNWPDSLIVRQINRGEANSKLAIEVLTSENISRTHKIELIQQSV